MLSYLVPAALAADPQSTAAQPSPFLQFLPLVFLFVVFYFLLIRPQQKRQKEHQDMIGKLQKNDEVVTLGGIHGTVVGVADKTVTLRIAENVKVEFDKSSVTLVKK